MYQMQVHGHRLTLQPVNDSFDIVFKGTMFMVLWEQLKRKNAFTWDNRNRKHDPFAVHNFGETVDRVVAPTTREKNTKEGYALNMMANNNDNELGKAASMEMSASGSSKPNPEREKAIKELEQEKESLYNELKASLGKSEADL